MKITLKKMTTPRMTRWLAPLLMILLVIGVCSFTSRVTHAENTSTPFITLLFSRTEMTAADGCGSDGAPTINDTNIARLDTTVAPMLQGYGFTGTGTLVTGTPNMLANAPYGEEGCVHYGDSVTSDWQDATNLATAYGWSFVSHTADYPGPAKMARLTPKQAMAETCGSEQAIAAHGLPGANGMIAYPGAQQPPNNLQQNYGQTCFDFARTYGGKPKTMKGITTLASVVTPYWQNTEAVLGGPCNDTTAACYTPSAPVAGTKRYTDPQTIINQINALQPGQWLTIQAYLLVNGTNDSDSSIGYTNNKTQWDCSGNTADHWTNDVERYCFSDYQEIVQAIYNYDQTAISNGTTPITVTDPATVAADSNLSLANRGQ